MNTYMQCLESLKSLDSYNHLSDSEASVILQELKNTYRASYANLARLLEMKQNYFKCVDFIKCKYNITLTDAHKTVQRYKKLTKLKSGDIYITLLRGEELL